MLRCGGLAKKSFGKVFKFKFFENSLQALLVGFAFGKFLGRKLYRSVGYDGYKRAGKVHNLAVVDKVFFLFALQLADIGVDIFD